MHKIPQVKNKNKFNTTKVPMSPAIADTLHHLAFHNSLQATFITAVSSKKIITANKAFCKLLGYSRKELLMKNRVAIFNINESSFKKMLLRRTAEGQAAGLVTVIKKSGKQIPCEITSSVFTDEDGIEKAITTIVDISQRILKQKNIDTKKKKIVADNIVLAKSKQKEIDTRKEKTVTDNIILAETKSDARLAENNKWIKYIAKTSYDVMWDWDVVTGEIYVGDSIEEVFGYKVQNNTVLFNDFSQCLLPEEKGTVEKKLLETLALGGKSWKDSFAFKRRDGSVAFTTSRASIVRDEEGKAIRLIGAIHDISRLQELENKQGEQITIPEEDSKRFLLAAKLSYDVIWDWKILTNEIFIGEGFEELFGYTIQNNKGNIADWGNQLHPDDRETVKKGLHEAIDSSAAHWQHAYRFMRADGSIAKVFDRASIFRNADGKAYRMIGVMQDISRQRENKRTAPELMGDKKSVLIENIKNVIEALVHDSNEQMQTNFSAYISEKLHYDYTYLANLFSETEGIPIRKFIISQKIKRVKELIVNDELNLTEIALELNYSSVAHLSHQFKKATGFTPSHYKQLNHKQRNTLQNV